MFKIKSSTSYAADSRYQPFIVALLLGAFMSLCISACGYSLSGINNKEQLFSPLLKTISIEGLARYDAFRVQLKKDMLSYKMRVVAPESATTRIIVKNKDIRQQAITIGDDVKVREYLLIASIDFSIIMPDEDSVQQQHPMQSLQSETSYTYYPQHISISLNEKKRALAFLNEDMSARLINQLRVLTKRKDASM